MIVGMNGFAGSGKDTVGDYLVAEYGFTKASFAKPMKESAAACLGLLLGDDAVAFWDGLKNDPTARLTLTSERTGTLVDISVREYLIYFGTEGHRKIDMFGEMVWVDGLLRTLDRDRDYVITDARFANELQGIIDAGGATIRVERESVSAVVDHESEAVPPAHLIHFGVSNDHGIFDLHRVIDAVMLDIEDGAF